MTDFLIEQDIKLIDTKVTDLKNERGISACAALAELLKAKAQLINANLALQGMEQYNKFMEQEAGMQKDDSE